MASTTTPIERLAGRILDLDYGDEQERLRYYEVYAIAVHLQLIVLPAVGAAVIAVAGRAATGPVLVMLAAAFVPILAGLPHLERHRVRIEAIAMSNRNRGYSIAYALSWLTLLGAVAIRADKSGFQGGLLQGAAFGLGVIVAVTLAVTLRSRPRRDASVEG